MKINEPKNLLDGIDGDTELVISVESINKSTSMVTYHIGYDLSENGELILKIAVEDFNH